MIASALAALQVAIQLVVFHTVDGYEVAVNPKQVTSLTAAKQDSSNKLLAKAVSCVIGMTNGKFHSVAESCEEVKRRLEEAK
jgi:hypothetical protein